MAEAIETLSADDAFDAGLTAQMRGDVDAAIACFVQVLKQKPRHPQAYLQLGKCEIRRGDLRTAMEAFRRGIRVAPRSAPLLAELGFLQLVTGDAHRAEQVLKAALRASKRNVRALQSLAWLHVHHQAWGPALAALRDLLAVSGSSFAGHYLMAQAQEALGNMADAHQEWLLTEDMCRKMIGATEGHVAAHYYLGEIMRSTRTWTAARADYEAAAGHAPAGAAGFLFGMGLAVPWSTVIAAAAQACAADGDTVQAEAWKQRLPPHDREEPASSPDGDAP